MKWLPTVLQRKTDGPILFFAPELILLRLLDSLGFKNEVQTTDFNSQDVDFPDEDIQKLSFGDSRFALIICNHVLEHVPDDRAAIVECARVLRPRGIAIFTMPGNFSISRTINYNHPDSNGHLRHYGMDITKKMEQCFSSVEPINMSVQIESSWKIHQDEYAFVCVK